MLEKTEYLNCNRMISFIKQVHNYEKINSIILTGGEPMLLKNIKDIIKQLMEYSKNISLLTNGTLIEDDIDFFVTNSIEVQVSLDSYKTSYHEKIRGYQKKTVDALKKFSKLSYRNVSINFTATPLNYKLLPEIKEFVDNNNFKLNVGIVNSKSPIFDWKLTSLETKRDFLHLYKESNIVSYKNKLLEYFLFRNQEEIYCPNINRCFTVDVNGNVMRCYSDYIIGNIYSMEVNRIIESMLHTKEARCPVRISCFDNI